MRFFLPRCLALLCGLWIAAGNRAFASAGPPDSDLTADPLVTYGSLSNGVRYALRPRTGSAHRLSMRLVVDAGSLDETESQRGIAHLLEHMAFNGSDHFPTGTIVELLQRQGLALGADTNANTTYDRTTYLLELRGNDAATVAESLDLFRDFAGGLTLPAATIPKERGIVLSEKLARDSATDRQQQAKLQFVLAGTLLPQRVTIGDPNVIAHADHDQLRAFYDAWYRPDRLTVVVVGDFDPAQMAAAIKSHFGRLRPRGRAHQPPPFGTIENAPGVHVKFLGDRELSGTSITFTVLHQQPAPPDSADSRLQELPRRMAFVMFNRRLAEVAAHFPSPFAQAGAVCGERLNLFQETSLTVASTGRRWQPALAAGEHELRRALQFGFQPAELRVASAVFVQELEQAVSTARSSAARSIANAIIDSLKAGQVYMNPADQLSLYTPALSQMSVATCNAAFRSAWQSPARFVVVAGDAVIGGDPDQAVTAAYQAAAAQPVTASAAAELTPWNYTDFGPPGTVAERQRVDRPEVLLTEFANGVRVNLKPTRFEENKVRLEIRLGTGRLEEPRLKPGLGLFTEQAFLAGGLNRYTKTDLEQVLAGKTVGLTFSVAEDAFRMTAVTNREDLLLQLQWVAAVLSDSAFRPEVQPGVRAEIGGLYSRLGHSAQGTLTVMLPHLLASNDLRFGYPPLRDTGRRTVAEMRAWLEPQLKTGPLELTIVGDFDEEAALSAVAQTLGALGPRRHPEALDVQRLVSFPPTPQRWEFRIISEVPSAGVAAYWPTEALPNERRRDRLELLAAILQDRIRLKLREQLGATYFPESSSYAPSAFPGFGYIRTQVTVDPAQAANASAVIAAIGADLSAHGVTADELERARRPLAARAHDYENSNAYWTEALAEAQAKPYTLEWARIRPDDFDTITATEVNALAALTFRPSNLCVAVVRPVKN